jgi:hypothetical protein
MRREAMAKIIGRYIVYTTDDEMPDCMGCDRCDDCDGKYCGPEYGWTGYKRTEWISKGEEEND